MLNFKLTSILVIVLLLLLSSTIIYAQLTTSTLTPDCKTTITIIKEPIYTSYVVNWPNSTKETRYNITGYKDVEVASEECKPPILVINDETKDYILQGYKCAQEGLYIVCDSLSDGNGDGKCAANGGETCCRIKDGLIQCKNSQISWDKPTGLISVSKLQ